MCRNYELQLQMVQISEDELRDQLARSQTVMKTLKDELRKEQNSKMELEEKFNEEAKTSDIKLKELTTRQEDSSSQFSEMKGMTWLTFQYFSLAYWPPRNVRRLCERDERRA